MHLIATALPHPALLRTLWGYSEQNLNHCRPIRPASQFDQETDDCHIKYHCIFMHYIELANQGIELRSEYRPSQPSDIVWRECNARGASAILTYLLAAVCDILSWLCKRMRVCVCRHVSSKVTEFRSEHMMMELGEPLADDNDDRLADDEWAV